MKIVICSNDKNQPLGANVVEGNEYEVQEEYINPLDQRVYIVVGLNNSGVTKMGMKWYGYKAERFKSTEDVSVKEEEHMFALN